MSTDTPCTDAVHRIERRVERQQRAAARAGDVVRWAHLHTLGASVRARFADAVFEVEMAQRDGVTGLELRALDGGVAGVALATVQHADDACATLDPCRAARLWALSVESARILRAWGVDAPARSLRWLREKGVTA